MARLRNSVNGVLVNVDDATAANLGREWAPVGVVAPKATAEVPGPFDPSAHKVNEVLAYLDGIDDTDPEAHDAEVARVIVAERAGKDRKSVLEAVEGTPDGDPAGTDGAAGGEE